MTSPSGSRVGDLRRESKDAEWALGPVRFTLRVLLDFTYLLVASVGVVWLHWRWSPPGLLRSAAAPATAPTAPTS